jgi:uncharacterized Ntn-hydrolase superfamily protein
MTFSIAARCARTGMFGVALSSSSPAVAARCAHARSGVGAICTQNITDPRLGPAGLDLLAGGASAGDVIEALRARAGSTAAYRQLTVVDRDGRTAAFTGQHALGLNGHFADCDAVAAGNMLADPDLPGAMASAFQQAPERHLAHRLLAALDAARATGGEAGPVHSAGLLIVDDQQWPLVDLRVDWSEDPIVALFALWAVWQPQMNDYVVRGLDPTAAPSYGVPGDP